jgi:indolepyruvate ferredoxin oxidoreductase alpha subunit
MAHPLLAPAGETLLLLGNEAIVRGALEAGVEVVTCYPGTPSSEVPDTFARLAADAGVRFEYSVNEKVALEVGGGASLAGALTLTTMKHVGVNVAADPLMTLAYIGTPGGLLLLSADDPGCHSSQNEQDNRLYARLAGCPVFEPASAQEAKDMTREALTLSRAWQQPVMLRTTTRLNHLRGPVTLGALPGQTKGPEFAKNPRRFVPIPAVARVRHGELLKNLAAISAEMAATPWNRVTGSGPVGLIVSGISRAYVSDVVEELNLSGRVAILELGFTNPLPEKAILDFVAGRTQLLVIEEGEPVIENEVRALLHKNGLDLRLEGKGLPGLSRQGEFSTVTVRQALTAALGLPAAAAAPCPAPEGLPMRPPNLCAGCPHRATYFTVRDIFGDTAVYSSDIGCYTLGILPPLAAADFLLCMGSSISAGSGFAAASGKPVVAFIGDSTFFHSGLTGLVNAVFNGHDLIVVIMDNATTAMTGHQPHPGVTVSAMGENPNRVDIEALVKACGVSAVRTVNPLNRKATRAALLELKDASGVRVLIAREPCPLHARRVLGAKKNQVAYVAAQSEAVNACVSSLACPAFEVVDGAVAVSESACSGCMFCLQIASDIKAAKRGSK